MNSFDEARKLVDEQTNSSRKELQNLIDNWELDSKLLQNIYSSYIELKIDVKRFWELQDDYDWNEEKNEEFIELEEKLRNVGERY